MYIPCLLVAYDILLFSSLPAVIVLLCAPHLIISGSGLWLEESEVLCLSLVMVRKW